jgi:dephospho-CoA kinase
MKRPRRNKLTLPLVIGLTGSIGMGKSTVSRMFARCGVPVLDSDIVVHTLLAPKGKAVAAVGKLFPATLDKNYIDRKKLGAEVFGNPGKLKQLEAILHPLVREAQQQFIQAMKRMGKKSVLLDIPLLFETKAELSCNKVVVVTAPPFIQKQRVLPRKNMTEEKFHRILTLQMPDREKRKRADVIINTGYGKAASLRQVKAFLQAIGS